MIQRKLIDKWSQMSSEIVKKLDQLAGHLTPNKRPIDEDETENVKKKRERVTPAYDGDYYFDFKNCLRYVYPYPFDYRAYAKQRWYGREIKEVYKSEFRLHSPNTLDYMFRSGKIKVNGKSVEPSYKIQNSDQIVSIIHRHENPVLASKINIINETEDTLVINKPSSIPIHTAGKYRLNTVLGILSNEYSYKDLYTVHRLDRLTSGVLIFAKTSKRAYELNQLILSREKVSKEYVCKVEGEFPSDDVVVCEEKLDVLDKKLGFRFVNGENGKDCHTKFKRLYTDGKTSIVHCKLETGRTHQIRVHLQYLGHPICNDPFYNSYAFGPNKGKGAEYLKLKSIKQLVQDIYDEHPNDKLHGNDVEYELKCQDLEQSLAQGEFYDDVNFKLAEEARFELIKNELFERHCKDRETTDELVEQHIDDLSTCEVLNLKSDIPYLRANKHMKFSREKFFVNPTCELCHLYQKAPKIETMSLYLHAMRYKIENDVYFAEPPSWAQFSKEFDYSKTFF